LRGWQQLIQPAMQQFEPFFETNSDCEDPCSFVR